MAPMPHALFFEGGLAIHGTSAVRQLGPRGQSRLRPAEPLERPPPIRACPAAWRCTGRALRPAGLLNRPRRPLSRGSAQSVPDQTARQLPEQSTTLRVEPSSTGDTRRRGARRVEDGRGTWALRQRSVSRPRSSNRTCGFPASGFPTGFIARHTAGAECGACCGSSGRWQTRPATPIGVRLRRGVKLLQKRPDPRGVQAHRQSPILGTFQSAQKQGPFPPPALPGLNGRMALSDSRPTRRLCGVGAASPSRDGSPPITRITLPTCRAQYPGGSGRVPVSNSSPLTRPSPFPAGRHPHLHFRGLLRLHARYGPLIARPPKAALSRGSTPPVPGQTPGQLPDQSTTLRVEPSSTGDTRPRGTRKVEDGRGGLGHAATLRFPSPLIKPDVRISRIRLSDWFHLAAHGGAPSAVRAAEAVGDGRRRVPPACPGCRG